MPDIALLIYNFCILLYGAGIFIASFFSKKAKLWLEGRRGQTVKPITGHGKRVWFHCASLGEFEQARPVIEKVKKEYPSSHIILTFFSPSGYEIRRNYDLADAVYYLPLDTKKNATEFIDAIKPDLALFVKYEFWYHHLTQLHNRKIPVILFSSIFRSNQIFFKWYDTLFIKLLSRYTKIFVQNEESQKLLKGIFINSEVANDTRFDRVVQVAQNKTRFTLVEKFKDNSKLLVAGSTWPKDDELLIKLINSNRLKGYKYIIAPHNIDQQKIDGLQNHITASTCKLSELNGANVYDARIVVVDSIGQLSSLYAYSNITYVGGGFNTSVHNVLEPAVFGMPLIFGPNHTKSAEAIDLKKSGAAFAINNYTELTEVLELLSSEHSAQLEQSCAIAKNYVAQRTGGTEVVFKSIEKYLN